MIERRLRTCSRSTIRADRSRSSSRPTRPTDRTDELVEAIAAREPRVRLLRCPRGGKVAAQNRAVRADGRRDPRVLGRERAVGSRTRCASSSATSPIRGRLRLRRPRLRGGRRDEPRRDVLAVRALAAPERVRARLDHRRDRPDLRRAPRGLRRRRPALRARPRLPVPDGAARQAGGLRRRRRSHRRSRRATSRTSTGARCACSSTAG